MIKVHPAAKIFPAMSYPELQELANDIAVHGLLQPIVVYDEMVIDGRNRLRACEMAGVEPIFKQYDGQSPVSFIVSCNLKRRHLTASQRAAIGAEIEPLFAEEAKKRNIAGGKAKEIIPYPQKGQARDQAAAAVKVSGKLVGDAKAIKQTAPDLFSKVKSGDVTVNQAKRELKISHPTMTPQQRAEFHKKIRRAGVVRIESAYIEESARKIRIAFSDEKIRKLISELQLLLKTEPEE